MGMAAWVAFSGGKNGFLAWGSSRFQPREKGVWGGEGLIWQEAGKRHHQTPAEANHGRRKNRDLGGDRRSPLRPNKKRRKLVESTNYRQLLGYGTAGKMAEERSCQGCGKGTIP